MNIKILSVFICMLMITAVLPAANSMNKTDNNQQYVKPIIDTECGCQTHNDITDKERQDVFPSYPTMRTQLVNLAPDQVTPKPQLMSTPDEFNWRDYDEQDWTTPAKKQLCGDCWDFAAIGVLESIINIREGCAKLNPDLSEQYVLSCLPKAGSCHGGSPSKALRLLMENTSEGNYHNGAIPELCFPYQGDSIVPCSNKCPNWVDTLTPLLDCGGWRTDGSAEDREAMKTQIMQTGPIAAGVKATNLFKFWGTIQHNPDKYFPYIKPVIGVNHIIMIVGWKDSPSIPKGGYWICKNSWGTDWGYEGFFNIEYNALNIDKSMIAWADYDPESVDWAPIADAGGLYFGDIEEEIQFDASNSFDAENEIISYYWDFGDGTNDTGVTVTHAYTQQGIYPVTLIITDNGGNTATDTTWAGIEQSIDPPNNPIINGPIRVAAGIEYEYTFTTTDPNGDDVYYYIEWGEYSSVGEWIGPYNSGEQIVLTHTWNNKGIYTVRAKAKDIYNQESDWGYLKVTMPRNQNIQINPQSKPSSNQQSSSLQSSGTPATHIFQMGSKLSLKL